MPRPIDPTKLTSPMMDNHEPSAMYTMLNQVLTVPMTGLNDQLFADYLWTGGEGPSQAERKTVNDLLGDRDKIEDQLRRQKAAHPNIRLMLIVEGIATPTPTGTTTWYESRTNKRIMHCGREFKLPLQNVYAWTYRVSKFLEVYFTPNMVCTARMITAFYKSDQKEKHSTFERYLKALDWHPNPQVQKLINVGSGIGEVRAEALIARFGTLWHVLSAAPSDLATVDGIGLQTAQQLLRKAGRTDA